MGGREHWQGGGWEQAISSVGHKVDNGAHRSTRGGRRKNKTKKLRSPGGHRDWPLNTHTQKGRDRQKKKNSNNKKEEEKRKRKKRGYLAQSIIEHTRGCAHSTVASWGLAVCVCVCVFLAPLH